ncbi:MULTISPECIES: thioesterase II family protein [Dickeya]|uniref:thioesterase II family protein n=1 Tax=Dickeya TaxID=204037 RepID=UPI00131F0912|nr:MULTISPECIES: alpha/beta fold hydrolase [Dickeya]UMB76757.1 alpha/beta fold hydrolase [Dickeya fangzhongdai]
MDMLSAGIFTVFRPNPAARIRLLCIPYAGGSANLYQHWHEYLPEDVEVVVAQLPGRSYRLSEPPHESMSAVVSELMTYIHQVLDRPLIIFGHSLGGCIGFALMVELQRRGLPLPAFFIGSASRPPHQLQLARKTHHVSDEKFIDMLREMKGTSEEILNSNDIMAMLLPMLRADFKISETYQYTDTLKYAVPAMFFSGDGDRYLPAERIALWQELFSSRVTFASFPGGHFFIHDHINDITQIIKGIAADVLNKTDGK